MTIPVIVYEKFGECISYLQPKIFWFPLAFLETEDSDSVHKILFVPEGKMVHKAAYHSAWELEVLVTFVPNNNRLKCIRNAGWRQSS